MFIKVVFLSFNHKFPWCEFSEYYFDIFYIFLEYFRIDEDIVEISYYKDVQIFNKCIIYELLAYYWCVNKSERYY